jgi:hypothetical protein
MSKSDRKSKAMSSTALISNTRSALSAMVDRECHRVGSRSVAYEIVAQTVGISPSWIRKFLSNSGEVKEPRITIFANIRAAYENLCERVELENRADELRLQALKGQMNAIVEGFGAQSGTENQDLVAKGEGLK